MSDAFTIEVDRFNAMLVTTGRGFWTTETVSEFLAAEQREIAALGVPVEELLILFDASNFAVQSQEVIELLRQPHHPLYHARRGAFVTPPGLGKLQIKRGTGHANIAVFATQSEARHYLLAD